MTNEQIEEFLKYHAYAYNQIDMQEAIEVLYKENKRLRKALNQIETHIRSTSNPIPHIVKTLKEVEVEPE